MFFNVAMAILEKEFKESYHFCLFAWLLFAEEKIPSQKETISQSIEKQSLSIKFAHPIEETKYVI